ncbi:MAG: translation initiation factor IF-2, partial [Flavobacteriales bacterium]|nr:translation initiation factor IF-2 [Flavobacteriales bacterium]
MSDTADKAVRLSKVAREFNLGVHTVVEFLAGKGHKVDSNPNTKISGEQYDLLNAAFGTSKAEKEASKQTVQQRQERESIVLGAPVAKEAPKRKAEEAPAPKAAAVPP